MKRQPTYTRAHAAIVHYVLQFATSSIDPVSVESDHPRTYGGIVGFVNSSRFAPIPGDLVMLSSAPASKWQLSWLVADIGNDTYLCESIADRQQCKWSNVRVSFFHRRTVAQHPEWRWSDDQFEFDDRWLKACKRHDPWVYRPNSAEFAEDGTASISVRMRHTNKHVSVVVPNWRKITQRDLAQLYLKLVEDHKAGLAHEPH